RTGGPRPRAGRGAAARPPLRPRSSAGRRRSASIRRAPAAPAGRGGAGARGWLCGGGSGGRREGVRNGAESGQEVGSPVDHGSILDSRPTECHPSPVGGEERRMSIVYNQSANRSLDRIGALSDGLFAIAMTLIVLEIHVPD